MHLEDIVFSITDTETTGTKQGYDKPIEIASVKWSLKKGFLEMPTTWTVDPKMPIHPSAMAVHHLTENDIQGKPEISEVQAEIENYVKDTVIIAHNAPFDQGMLPFLNNSSFKWLDSLRLARHIWHIGDLNSKGLNLTSHKCQELRYWLNLEVDTMGLAAHRAAADILVTGEVFGAALKNYLSNSNNVEFDEFEIFANAPIVIQKMPFGKHSGENLIDVPTSYWKWMLNECHKEKMTIDNDLKYNIHQALKLKGIEPADLIIQEKAQNWIDVAKNRTSYN